MRVTVTRAAGYIGSRLIERLRRAGHEVLTDRESRRPATGTEVFHYVDAPGDTTAGVVWYLSRQSGGRGITAT